MTTQKYTIDYERKHITVLEPLTREELTAMIKGVGSELPPEWFVSDEDKQKLRDGGWVETKT
jgi:hypothetical protein